ncbi:MAG TPA: V-type ATP synthase subunit E [Vicinamibacterales bacterium]|nr:V-type ATP synthase subunit E [Vicinamibacterales bacterium]
MALADLVSRLEQEAQNRIQAIQQDAEVEVRRIDAATEQAVAAIAAHHLDRQRAGRRTARQRELALARHEARGRELEARRTQLTRILDRARSLLPGVAASTAYVGVLPLHLEEALSFLEGLRPRVRCQAAVASVLHDTIARTPGAQLVIDESVGPGVVAEAADGSVVVDNTLVARLARAESRLAIELLRKLDDAG